MGQMKRNMKKVIITAICAIIVSTTYAQISLETVDLNQALEDVDTTEAARISDEDFEKTDESPIRFQHGEKEDYLVDDPNGGQYIMLKDDFEDMYEMTNFVRRVV